MKTVSRRKFTREQAKTIRSKYDDGISTCKLAAQYKTWSPTIAATIGYAGGKLRSRSEAGREHSSERFQRIHKRYGLWEHSYWELWYKQKRNCWWCGRKMPKTSACVIDHRGRKVRGLCCPDNRCNMVAGHLESFWKVPAKIIRNTFMWRKKA